MCRGLSVSATLFFYVSDIHLLLNKRTGSTIGGYMSPNLSPVVALVNLVPVVISAQVLQLGLLPCLVPSCCDGGLMRFFCH